MEIISHRKIKRMESANDSFHLQLSQSLGIPDDKISKLALIPWVISQASKAYGITNIHNAFSAALTANWRQWRLPLAKKRDSAQVIPVII